MLGIFLELLVSLLGIGLVGLASSARVVKQYERGVVFRLGRARDAPRGPGLTMSRQAEATAPLERRTNIGCRDGFPSSIPRYGRGPA